MEAERYDLSPTDVAELVGVSVDSIKRWTDAGDLPVMVTPGKWRRYRRSDVEQFIAKRSKSS